MCGRLRVYGCKNLAHMSKTRQVKRPKRLQLLGSRFACLLLFQTAKSESNETAARKDVRCRC